MGLQKYGDQHITFEGIPTGYLLSDYWAWNASELLNNTLRGSYCEFVISSALGLDLSGVNEAWGAYDINFPFRWNDDGVWRDEIHIEVKSGAYLQAWQQNKLSNILFSIHPTRAWAPITGYSDEVKRQSDVYVFCHYTATERSKADPLILDDWDFYIIRTRCLTRFAVVKKHFLKITATP